MLARSLNSLPPKQGAASSSSWIRDERTRILSAQVYDQRPRGVKRVQQTEVVLKQTGQKISSKREVVPQSTLESTRPASSRAGRPLGDHTFEKKLNSGRLDVKDRLRVWSEYVQWASANLPAAKNAIISRACRNLHSRVSFLQVCNEIEYLRLWVQHAGTISNPHALFQTLERRGVGIHHALLYETWADDLERRKLFAEAGAVYKRGLERHAKPFKRLRHRCDEFMKRMGSAVGSAALLPKSYHFCRSPSYIPEVLPHNQKSVPDTLHPRVTTVTTGPERAVSQAVYDGHAVQGVPCKTSPMKRRMIREPQRISLQPDVKAPVRSALHVEVPRRTKSHQGHNAQASVQSTSMPLRDAKNELSVVQPIIQDASMLSLASTSVLAAVPENVADRGAASVCAATPAGRPRLTARKKVCRDRFLPTSYSSELQQARCAAEWQLPQAAMNSAENSAANVNDTHQIAPRTPHNRLSIAPPCKRRRFSIWMPFRKREKIPERRRSAGCPIGAKSSEVDAEEADVSSLAAAVKRVPRVPDSWKLGLEGLGEAMLAERTMQVVDTTHANPCSLGNRLTSQDVCDEPPTQLQAASGFAKWFSFAR